MPEAELSRVDYVKVLVFTSDEAGPGVTEEETPVQPPLEGTTTTETTATTVPESGTTGSP